MHKSRLDQQGNKREFYHTFRELEPYELNRLWQLEPSCYNGIIRYKKKTIIIVNQEEDIETYVERFHKLWDDPHALPEDRQLIGETAANEHGYVIWNRPVPEYKSRRKR